MCDEMTPSSSQTRKRTRRDSLKNSGPPEKYQAMSQQFVHDDIYYFEDGSCVLLVEDTLFNVPRFMASASAGF